MNRLLQSWVTQHAEAHPDADAVVLGTERLTYGQLEARSNQLAYILREGGCERGDRVGIVMPKSPSAIVAMLGILKAGCMHVPIDIASPAARIQQILGSCENRWILAAGPVAPLLEELLSYPHARDSISVGWLGAQAPQQAGAEFCGRDLDRAPSGGLPPVGAPSDGSHILFTSGSTGVPKGVVITHSNVIAFVSWALAHFQIDRTDRFSGHTPFHFDLSTFDIFGSITAGAQLHLVPGETALLPPKLAEFIRSSELTQWFSVPSVLNYLAKFNAVQTNDFPSLRRVLWCGEVLPTPALIYWMHKVPHARFTNLYGPTEATIASSYYDLPACPTDPGEAIPIGRACAGEQLLVLDQQLRPVAVRAVGDLHIEGAGLSPGYWRDPEKTAQAFLRVPGGQQGGAIVYKTGDLAWKDEEGMVHFVGRADTQIKVRGYRIELGEIETALHSYPGLQEGAVIAIQNDNFGGWMICCAYVPRELGQITPNQLRDHLKKLVPSYMIPVRWSNHEALPKNANGKTDRPKLKELFAAEEAANSGTRSAIADKGVRAIP